MQVDVTVRVPVEHSFGPAGNDTQLKVLIIHSYHPSPASPRVELCCPDGSRLIIIADALLAGVRHAAVQL
jgi:hypothetical protein